MRCARRRLALVPSSLFVLVLPLVLVVVGSGCADSRYFDPAYAAPKGLGTAEERTQIPQSPSPDMSLALEQPAAALPAWTELDTPPQQTSRIMVYTATYRVVVGEVEESIRKAEKLAGSLGGYVGLVDGARIVLRIPVQRYREGLAAIETMGQVAHRAEEALDVTEQYVDLEARLKNALAVRERLKALLERAEDVKTALEVEKELKRVGEEIESLEARLEVLKNRVAFCTVTVMFERIAQQTHFSGATRLPFDWLRRLDPNRLW